MRTLRLSLMGGVVLALLGGLGGGVVAQEDEATGPATVFTGQVTSEYSNWANLEFSEQGEEEDWVGHILGVTTDRQYEWSDPRLPSRGTDAANLDLHEPGDVITSMWLLEGPEGHWTGPWTGFCDTGDYCRGSAFLTGHGAYEGLSALLVERPLEPWPRQAKPFFEGLIFEGTMPPMPEPLEPTTE